MILETLFGAFGKFLLCPMLGITGGASSSSSWNRAASKPIQTAISQEIMDLLGKNKQGTGPSGNPQGLQSQAMKDLSLDPNMQQNVMQGYKNLLGTYNIPGNPFSQGGKSGQVDPMAQLMQMIQHLSQGGK